MEELVTLSITQLEELMKKKLIAAGLPQEAASETAKHLAIADATGVHSHGAVRMDYYANGSLKAESHWRLNYLLRKPALLQGFFMATMAWDNTSVMKR